MRFDHLALTKYGVYAELSLSIDDKPGLVVIYGPNEAGKSTCLSAISDFLFGIPATSPHGQFFGYDKMRLDATVRLSTGSRMTLRRRKGNTKTLMDADGNVVEDRALSSILGPTTRERFKTLFGLGHKDLREGGERLIQADGDIGRMIVEAGGGLRALVGAIDALGQDAEKLFTIRRAADREFYRARDAFEEADKAVKANLRTREAHEQARSQAASAEQEYENLKARQRLLTEQLSREQRVERVVPSLIELDLINKKIDTFADLPALRPDFAAAVRDAIAARNAARAAFAEANDSWVELESEIKALVIPKVLIDAEPGIRDIVQRSVHVDSERKSRPNRIIELSRQEAQLATLREHIGIPPEVDLIPLLPQRPALDRVRRLAKQGLESRLRIESLEEQIKADQGNLSSLEKRQAKRSDAGTNKPFGINASEFGSLPRLAEDLKARTAEIARIRGEIENRLRMIGIPTIEALRGFRCPDAASVQAELERRVVLESELTKLTDTLSLETARRESALSAIQLLKTGGEIPTDSVIAAARAARHEAWIPIRGTYLAEDAAAIVSIRVSRRNEAVSTFETRVGEADQLADRKSVEAQRITDLLSAEKQSAEADAAIRSAVAAKQEIEARLDELRRQFEESWPEAVARTHDLVRLKLFVTEREAIIERAEAADKAAEEIERLRAEHNPRLEFLSLAEKQLKMEIAPTATLPARIQTVTRKIKAHDDDYADYRTDAATIEQFSDQLVRKRNDLAALENERSSWLAQWQSAALEIGLKDEVSPEFGSEVVNEWSTAKGVLEGIKTTKRRLSQFEEDESALRELIATLAPEVGFVLPGDPVAAAGMLEERLNVARKTETRKTSLEPQLVLRAKDRDSKAVALKSKGEALAALCAEAGTDELSVLAVADRHEQYLAAKGRREQILLTLQRAGDGREIETIREEWGGRDLDGVRADVGQISGELHRLATEMEAGFANVKDRRRDLEPFESGAASINALVAERESARAEMQRVVHRYLEVSLARALLEMAVGRLRSETQSPLVARAGDLFALTTCGAFVGIGTDVDEKSVPVIIGKRPDGGDVTIHQMSDGTRDQLFLSFRLASIEQYCAAAEPLPFIADDLLVHFDDERSAATLNLLAEVAQKTQVLLFTHHTSVRDAAAPLVEHGRAGIIELA